MPADDLRCPQADCLAWQNWRFYPQELGRFLQGWKGWVTTLIGIVIVTFVFLRLVLPLFDDGLEGKDIKVSECRSDSLRVQIFNRSYNDVYISDLKILRRNFQSEFEEFNPQFLDPDPRSLFAEGNLKISRSLELDEEKSQFGLNSNSFSRIFRPSEALASGRFHMLEPQERVEDCEYLAKVTVAKSGKEYTSDKPCICGE